VQKAEKQTRLAIASKAVMGLVLSCSILLAAFLAVEHGSHQAFHSDADHPEHQCLAAALSHGLVDSAAPAPVVVVTMDVSADGVASSPAFFLPSTPYRLLPGRAPPVRFA